MRNFKKIISNFFFTKNLYRKLSEIKKLILILKHMNRTSLSKDYFKFILKSQIGIIIFGFYLNRKIEELRLKNAYKKAYSTIQIHDGLRQYSIKTIYINLDKRTDRNIDLMEEFLNFGINNYSRFKAVEHQNGSLGCTLSHKNLILSLDEIEEDIIMICEDDIKFLADKETFDIALNEFFNNRLLEVLVLADNRQNSFKISHNLSITSDTYTTACYVIKKSILQDLVKCYSISEDLLKAGLPNRLASIDVVWKQLQNERFFAVTNEKIVWVKNYYSDIDKEFTTYGV